MITTDSLGFIDNLANSLRAVYLNPARMAGFSSPNPQDRAVCEMHWLNGNSRMSSLRDLKPASTTWSGVGGDTPLQSRPDVASFPHAKTSARSIAFRAVVCAAFTDNRYQRFVVATRYRITSRHNAKWCGNRSWSGRAWRARFASLPRRSTWTCWSSYARRSDFAFFARSSAWARWSDRSGRTHLTHRSGRTDRTLRTGNSLRTLRSDGSLDSLSTLRTSRALSALLWLLSASSQAEY